MLAAGQSFSVELHFQLSNSSDLSFANYAINLATPNDPDNDAIGAILGSGDDPIDDFILSDINNFSAAVYPLPVTPPVPVPETTPPSTIETIKAALATTGQSVYAPIVAGIFIVSSTFLVGLNRRRSRYKLLK